VDQEEQADSRSMRAARVPDTDAHLLEQLRSGEAEAGHRFVREHYPAIYRYLLYLAGRPDLAEDLTQETFVQAWRALDRFQGRAALRTWLHRIAHREFLQMLRRQRTESSLETAADWEEPSVAAWTEAVELREVIRRLPLEQREAVVLHYLEGYNSEEIGRIVRAPASTVRYRLAAAREYLRQELGEGDLVYLNEPQAPMRQWAWLPLDQMHALEARLGAPTRSVGPGRSASKEEAMERREFLRHAAAGAAGMMLPDRDAVDTRLTHKVTLAFKGAALADVCEHLRSETGIHVVAGASVVDEKVTLFCKQLPLRDAMRQLSRPFGYTWVRSGTAGAFRYELVQDLRSQLLEEELRNRDRNAALLSLERELERYRPYLGLTPDEVVARARSAPPEEKKVLENLGGGSDLRSGLGWGPIQMYFRLSAQELAALRAGEELCFSQEPRPGERPLPPDVARGILQSWRHQRVLRYGSELGLTGPDDPDGVPVHTVPELRATQKVRLYQTELGRYGLNGASGFRGPDLGRGDQRGPYAVGISPTVLEPDNATANARFAGDAALRIRISVQPQPSCRPAMSPGTSSEGAPEPKVTTADVLEAIHRATGFPVASDYYTRLYNPSELSARNLSTFEALNRLGDAMRLRWNRDGSWLQFRSTSFYDDRLKEVPNRLLTSWRAARQRHGMLTLDDLIEVAALPDAQLQGEDVAEGAKTCDALTEWDLARNHMVLPNLRFLAQFTPAQRQEAMSETGLPFTRMSLAQQQAFLARALRSDGEGLQSLEELAGATLRVDYWQPGWYEWRPPGPLVLRWLVPMPGGESGGWIHRPRVRERTREAALVALRRVDGEIRAAVRAAAIRADPRIESAFPDDEAQIAATNLDLVTIYVPNTPRRKHPIVFMLTDNYTDTTGW
jgi:RNA polymerase sigma-70 factor, ECF subfamily